MAMGPMFTWRRESDGQVALRSSAPIASSTATLVVDRSGDRALADARTQQVAQLLLVVVGGFGERIDEPLDRFDEAVRIIMEREMA